MVETKVEKLPPPPAVYRPPKPIKNVKNERQNKFEFVIDETDPDPEVLEEAHPEERLEDFKRTQPVKLEPAKDARINRLTTIDAMSTQDNLMTKRKSEENKFDSK